MPSIIRSYSGPSFPALTESARRALADDDSWAPRMQTTTKECHLCAAPFTRLNPRLQCLGCKRLIDAACGYSCETVSGRRVMGCSSCISPWDAAKSPATVEWTAVEVTEHQFTSDLDGFPSETLSSTERKRSYYVFVPKLSPIEHPSPCPSMVILEPPISIFQPYAEGLTRESNEHAQGSDPKDDDGNSVSTPSTDGSVVGKKLETGDISTPNSSSPGRAVLRGGSRCDGDRPAASAMTGGVDRVSSHDRFCYHGEAHGADEMEPNPTLNLAKTVDCDGGKMPLASRAIPPSFLPGATATDLVGPVSSCCIKTPLRILSKNSTVSTAPSIRCSKRAAAASAAAAATLAPLTDGQPRMYPGLWCEVASSLLSRRRRLRGWEQSGGFAIGDWSAGTISRLRVSNKTGYDSDDEDTKYEEKEGGKVSEEEYDVKDEERDHDLEHAEEEDEELCVEGSKGRRRRTGFRAGLCVTGVLAMGIGIGIAVWARRRR